MKVSLIFVPSAGLILKIFALRLTSDLLFGTSSITLDWEFPGKPAHTKEPVHMVTRNQVLLFQAVRELRYGS
jgi:hypothetical protein